MSEASAAPQRVARSRGREADAAPETWPEPRNYSTTPPLASDVDATDAEMKSAMDVVRATALPAALKKRAPARSAIVLRYPRTVGYVGDGAFRNSNSKTAEWLVFLDVDPSE